METDVLILGCGIAGLSSALQLAEKHPTLSICIISKERVEFSNSFMAQGGIACVSNVNEDNFEKHIADTIEAGAGLCLENTVRQVVTQAPFAISDLERWGVEFDKTDQEYSRGKEGGHSENRILHCKDATGKSVIEKLYKRVCQFPRIKIIQDGYTVELLTNSKGNCEGAYVFIKKMKAFMQIRAKCTILATGGAGQLFAKTTNAKIATGEGFVLAEKIGAQLKNLEFIQFHPTAFYAPKETNVFLFTEALRGEGAILRNNKGEAFMENYSDLKELAPRDIVSRAIFHEMRKQATDFVFLDLQPIFENKKEDHFPTILEFCQQKGIDPQFEWIPISPAMHYMCGGVEVNNKGETTVSNLYACGEVAYTGLHGANRLASNSLLEALVYARCIAQDILSKIDDIEITFSPKTETNIFPKLNNVHVVDAMLRNMMSKHVAIVRSPKELESCLDQLEIILKSISYTKPENEFCLESDVILKKILIAEKVIQAAYQRKESVGGHYMI